MFLLAGAAIGAALLYLARVETKQSWYAPTDARAVAHVKTARVYKVIGWIFMTVCLVLPLAFIALLVVVQPEIKF